MKPKNIQTPMVDVIARHVEFAFNTFGPGPRLEGTLAHIRKELTEIEADPFDVFEWVDLILLAINGAARHGYDAELIAAAFLEKIEINEGRTWPDWRTAPEGEAIEHIRTPEETHARALLAMAQQQGRGVACK